MSNWFKKSKSEIVLYHTSDIPYYINSEYVLLCNNNLLSEELTKIDNFIGFSVNYQKINRYSANYWCLKEFPYKIPTESIVKFCNKGCKNNIQDNSVNIGIVKFSYLESLSHEKSCDLMDEYDKVFALSYDDDLIEDNERTFLSQIDNHFHDMNWHTAILNILNDTCLHTTRGQEWTQDIPDLNLEIYGITKMQEWDEIFSVLDDFSVSDKISCVIK